LETYVTSSGSPNQTRAFLVSNSAEKRYVVGKFPAAAVRIDDGKLRSRRFAAEIASRAHTAVKPPALPLIDQADASAVSVETDLVRR
jgi:hypothetical protein